MESNVWQQSVVPRWTNAYALLAPRVSVTGRMALVLLAAVIWAFGWLIWRAYLILQTPNDILVDKLGLDIPPLPLITLEEVGPREVHLSWKTADPTSSILEHIIEVNGQKAGDTKRHETAIAIGNLQPETLYDIRIFSVSSTRFQTPSGLLRVRTSAASDSPPVDQIDTLPVVRALAPRLPQTPLSATAPSIAREQINLPAQRRSTLGRKSCPADPADGLQDCSPHYDEDTDANLSELSQQFSKLQRDFEAVEVQIQSEDDEFETTLKEKEAEREDVRQRLREREEISSTLRKEVAKVESQNRSVQSEKAKKEALLKQKQEHRRKMKDDLKRWDHQAETIAQEMEGIKTQQAAIERRKHNDIAEVRKKIEEEQLEINALDQENRERGRQVKALEEERKQLNAEEETDETREDDRKELEKEKQWRQKMHQLQNTYSRLYYDLQQAHQQFAFVQDRLDNARRAVSYIYAPALPLDFEALRRGAQTTRRNRHPSSHGSNVSSPRTVFGAEPYNMNSHLHKVINTPQPGPHTVFNFSNGMTIYPNDGSRGSMASIPIPTMAEEPEPLEGTPMSPRVDLLLPTDLLSTDSNDDLDEEDIDNELVPRSASGAVSNKSLHDLKDGMRSPSGTSSSPRSLSSPRNDSMQALRTEATPGSPDGQVNDKESNGVEEPHDHTSTTSKKQSAMSNLFSFSRPRGKTSNNQPPALGDLKGSQSQSFPRNLDELDPESQQPRRRLSYGGNWAFGSGLLHRGQSMREEDNKISATRRGFPFIGRNPAASQSYDPFAPDGGLRGEGSPSRPASVYSFDKMPRPSMDNNIWSVEKGMRNSPLGDWSSLSRNPSRRPSLGYGSTSNLSLGPIGDDEEYVPPRRESLRPLQAPIGTRPAPNQPPGTPKLNPAAKSFTMLFSKDREKAKEKAKAREREKDRDAKLNDVESSSPPESRKSKDTYSIAATASTHESRDSLERTPSGYSGGVPAELTPSKPTLMSRISRKASSTKFGSWKGQGSMFSRKDPATPTGAEIEEESTPLSPDVLSKSFESMNATPVEDRDKKASRSSLGSWKFLRKDKAKKDDLAPSEISEDSSQRISMDIGEESEG